MRLLYIILLSITLGISGFSCKKETKKTQTPIKTKPADVIVKDETIGQNDTDSEEPIEDSGAEDDTASEDKQDPSGEEEISD